MKTQTIALVVVVGLSGTLGMLCAAEPGVPVQVGDKAPALSVDALVDYEFSEVSPLPDLKGKVVVLEFWATWCVPCVATIPHLNKIALEFEGKDVVFISISQEDHATVREFVRRRPMRGTVAIDSKGTTFDVFGVETLPQTIVIGRENVVAVVTDPFSLSADILRDVLKGKPVTVPPPSIQRGVPVRRGGDGDIEAPPLVSVSIRRFAGGARSVSGSASSKRATGWSVGEAASYAYDKPMTRIIVSPEISHERYDVEVSKTESTPDGLRAVLRGILEPALGVQVRVAPSEMEVLILRVASSSRLGTKRSVMTNDAWGVSSGSGRIDATNLPMVRAALVFEKVLGVPVFDESASQERFDWAVQYNDSDPKSLIQQLSKELGVELVRSKRRVDLLRICRNTDGKSSAEPTTAATPTRP